MISILASKLAQYAMPVQDPGAPGLRKTKRYKRLFSEEIALLDFVDFVIAIAGDEAETMARHLRLFGTVPEDFQAPWL